MEIGCGSIALLVFFAFVVIAGIDAVTGNHAAPLEAEVVSVTGRPSMVADRSDALRRKSFSFGVGGETFFVEKQNWDDAQYERVRSAVYDSEEFTIGVTPEGCKSMVPFWSIRADGNVVQSYGDMLGHHKYHRRMSLITVSVYGGAFLLPAIFALVSWVRGRQRR